MASYGLPAQAKATPRQDPLLFLGGPRPVGQAFAANRHPKATSMAFYGRPSLPFASPKTLQTPKTPKRPLQWLLMGFQRRQKLPQGQIHCCFWAVQRAVRQAFAANGHPKATSMASYGLPAQAKATPRQDPLLFLGGPRPVGQAFAANRHPKATSMAFYGRPSLPFASPKTLQTPKTPKRPLQWLLMGFQRRQKLPQGQIHCCFWAVQRAVRQAFAANGHPKATSMAFSGRPSLPFASPKTLQTAFPDRWMCSERLRGTLLLACSSQNQG